MTITNMRKLAIAKMAAIMIPPGTSNPMGAGIAALTDPAVMSKAAREGEEFAKQAVAVIRTASDPNPWKNATDQEIAGEILKKLDERNTQILKRAMK